MDDRKDQFGRRKFLQTTIGAVGALAFRRTAYSSHQPRERNLYVGTYTTGKSEGIYCYRMDPTSGALKSFGSIKADNPSFLAIDEDRRFLYAVNELKEFAGKPSGAVSAFGIDATSGKLAFLNQQPSLGADPCHLTIDRRRRFLLVANYTGGSLSVLSIQRDGSLGMPTDLVQHEGNSIKEQQQGPHAHCIILDRYNRQALAADLGTDKVMVYRFDRTTGKLKPNKTAWVSLKPGAGPRHLTLHPRRKYAYVINELDSTMSVFRYDPAGGNLNPLQTVSTLPKDFSDQSFCADLHVSPSGKFLYGSNRGHNSIVVFAIDESTGQLTFIEHVSTLGNWPRNFTIDPTGRFLLVANQRSDNVVTFRIDSRTGKLTATGQVVEIPTPVCLKFA
jgi:6-phosphogluconolactonase